MQSAALEHGVPYADDTDWSCAFTDDICARLFVVSLSHQILLLTSDVLSMEMTQDKGAGARRPTIAKTSAAIVFGICPRFPMTGSNRCPPFNGIRYR